MADTLTTTSSSGQQTSTGNPQIAPPQSGGPSTESAGIQPGTTSSLLTATSAGLPLNTAQPLTTVDLKASATATTATTTPQIKDHQVSPGLIGLTIALFALAIIAFWVTSRSAKTTTNY